MNLPSRAPCEGVADLSREAEPAKLAVQLEPPVAKVIVAARIAAAKAAAEAKARIAAAAKARIAAAAKAKRGKLLAKGRGGKDKPTAAKVAEKPAGKTGQPAKIVDRAPTDRVKNGKTRLAETSAAKR